MNSEYLRTFVMLTQMGSYTKTAEKLAVAPSTISKQVKQLERDAGQILVIRDKKAARLTRAGEVFLDYAQRILDAEDACMNRMRSVEADELSVRIGAEAPLFNSRISPWLSEYLREDDPLHLSIILDRGHRLMDMLNEGMIDLCACYRSNREPGCVRIPLVTDELILVTSGKNSSCPESVTSEELRTLPLLKEQQLQRAAPELYKEIFDVNDSSLLSVPTGDLLIPQIKKGLGCGFVIRYSVKEELASGALRQIRVTDRPPILRESFLYYKKNNSLITQQILDAIRKIVDADL